MNSSNRLSSQNQNLPPKKTTAKRMGKGIKFYNSDEEDEKDDRQKSNHGADVVVKKYDT
jgi:hypothetical protein